jgi:hypothetical protein
MSSNHTEAIVQCCHCKHAVASSRTLLSDHLSTNSIVLNLVTKLPLRFAFKKVCYWVHIMYQVNSVNMLLYYNPKIYSNIIFSYSPCPCLECINKSCYLLDAFLGCFIAILTYTCSLLRVRHEFRQL